MHDKVAHTRAVSALVNGEPRSLDDTPVHTTALDWLRGCGLTGAKEGCAEGECGACSVLVARPGVDAETEWVALNACLVPALSLDGQEVVTSEGLSRGRSIDDLHPVQREMAERGGSQCGYCTPGFVCSMAAEFYRPGRCDKQGYAAGLASADHAEHAAEHGPNGFDLHALSGNLCRCTGYRPIRDAAYALGAPETGDPFMERMGRVTGPATETRVERDGSEFVRPARLPDALALLAERPDAVVVAGSTDLGVEVNLRGSRPTLTVAIDRLPELRSLDEADDVIEIGAALSLTEIERRLAGRVPLLADLFPQFASRLIRNGATLGGNLGTGSPIGDSPPVLLALEATVVLVSFDANGEVAEREVALRDYFTGYRQSVRLPGELIKSVRIPRPLAGLTGFHKIAKRRFDDISSVAVAFALDVEDGIVARAAIGLGGVAAMPIRATTAEALLVGRPWTRAVADEAARALGHEGTPLSDHRASAEYRSAMLANSLRKLHAEHPGDGPGAGRRTHEEVGA